MHVRLSGGGAGEVPPPRHQAQPGRSVDAVSPTPRVFSSVEETNGPAIRMHGALGFVPSGYIDNLLLGPASSSSTGACCPDGSDGAQDGPARRPRRAGPAERAVTGGSCARAVSLVRAELNRVLSGWLGVRITPMFGRFGYFVGEQLFACYSIRPREHDLWVRLSAWGPASPPPRLVRGPHRRFAGRGWIEATSTVPTLSRAFSWPARLATRRARRRQDAVSPADDPQLLRLRLPARLPLACALEVTVDAGRIAAVAGDPAHPFTRGVICGKVTTTPSGCTRRCASSPLRRSAPRAPAGSSASAGRRRSRRSRRWRASSRPVGRRGDPAVLVRRLDGTGPVLRRPPALPRARRQPARSHHLRVDGYRAGEPRSARSPATTPSRWWAPIWWCCGASTPPTPRST